MKQLLLGLIFLFALAGLVFYNNMMHLACVVSLFLALASGTMFTLYLNRRGAEKLARQEELRRQLTADVAHELRTPLTAVSTNLEAMAAGALAPTTERLNDCYGEIQRLGKLVADLESLAKTESELHRLTLEPVDLLDLVREVFGTASGERVTVSADRERMLQVLTNLRSNAEKYGNGGIDVTVKSNGKYGEIAVRDDGIGISAEDLPHVFERFYRADKSRTRSTGGAGIGLAIVAAIVAAHGGAVVAESALGEGSTFTVRLMRG
ncbi:MAG: HAMP domain-containing histidine kinase [Oscillospiraceae bacterium]|jgi:signal transduction histidine kinase|nr:HAMP domain-containing histidine kinase [Oscillospiraceae bacterium]